MELFTRSESGLPFSSAITFSDIPFLPGCRTAGSMPRFVRMVPAVPVFGTVSVMVSPALAPAGTLAVHWQPAATFAATTREG